MKLFNFGIAVVATAMFCSCTESTSASQDSDGPITVPMNKTENIVDRGSGFLVSETPVCRQGVYSIKQDTGYYSIANGTLLAWSNDECQATVYSGSGAMIEGVWNLEDTIASIPGGASPNCTDANEVLSWISNIAVTMTVSATEVQTLGSMDICMAENMAESVGMGMVADGCNKLKWVANGDVATLQITAVDLQNSSMSVLFSFKGTNCEMKTVPEVAPSAEACTYSWTKFVSEDDPDAEWDEESFTENPQNEFISAEWGACLRSTGFGQGSSAVLMKRVIPEFKLSLKRFM